MFSDTDESGALHLAVMPILMNESFLSRHTLQQRLPVLFSRLDNLQNCPFLWGILTPV